jgi:hypothetical protein
MLSRMLALEHGDGRPSKQLRIVRWAAELR